MSGPLLLPSWEQLAAKVPGITEPMRRYLEQIACVLRPGSVVNTDQTLRCFAAFLAEAAPGLTGLAQITRRHVEAFKPWLAARPGQNKPKVAPATIAHRLGTLRMFFIRIGEWGWDDAPARVPMFPGDLPRLDRPLPRALDDAAAAKLLRAARQDRRMLVRVTVEMLLRTGLRVSEYTSLPASAVVLIGAGPWLHVPVGKLGEDRYLPLHPQLVTLIDTYRTACVPPDHPLLLPRENGRPLDRHTVTRMINRAGAAAGLPHIHPHQLRHPLATQAKVSRIASDASFRSLREHALPAAQRAALRCPRPAGPPRGWGDLGLHGPPGSDATMMQLIPLRGPHHHCACWHRDASGSSRLHRMHHRQAQRAAPGRHRRCEGRAGPPHHWSRYAPGLSTSRCRCT